MLYREKKAGEVAAALNRGPGDGLAEKALFKLKEETGPCAGRILEAEGRQVRRSRGGSMAGVFAE